MDQATNCDICSIGEYFTTDAEHAEELRLTFFPPPSNYKFLVWYILEIEADVTLITMLNKYRAKRDYPDMFQDMEGCIDDCAMYGGGRTRPVMMSGDIDYDENCDTFGKHYPLSSDDADDIALCSNCYHWFTMLHPEYKSNFARKHPVKVAYQAWLKEQEEKSANSINSITDSAIN